MSDISIVKMKRKESDQKKKKNNEEILTNLYFLNEFVNFISS